MEGLREGVETIAPRYGAYSSSARDAAHDIFGNAAMLTAYEQVYAELS